MQMEEDDDDFYGGGGDISLPEFTAPVGSDHPVKEERDGDSLMEDEGDDEDDEDVGKPSQNHWTTC